VFNGKPLRSRLRGKTDEFEGVIFSRANAQQVMPSSGEAPDEEKFWTPGRKDVLRLEERIETYLRKAASLALASKLPKYKRQYLGITQNGRRVIFVNFFCEDPGPGWETSLVTVMDGGDCFFRVLYDPESSGFFHLVINGEA
jgi:hypothetical protein